MEQISSRVLVLMFAALALIARRDAVADTKGECSDAYEATQTLRASGRLTEARELALACSDASCPGWLVKDCSQWAGEIESSLPTIVLNATDASGADAREVSVSIDGKHVVDKLDGKAMPIDPGDHVVRFEMNGADPLEQKVVISQGQKNRSVVAAFKAGASSADPALPPTAGGGARSPQPVIGAILMGVGGATLVMGIVAGGLVLAQNPDLVAACPNAMCPSSEADNLDAYHAKSIASTVGFVLGPVLGATGLIVFLTAPKAKPKEAAPADAGVRVVPYVGLGVAGAAGRF